MTDFLVIQLLLQDQHEYLQSHFAHALQKD